MRTGRVIGWLALGGLGYLAYRVMTQQSVSGSIAEKVANLASDVMGWKSSANAQKYLPYIAQVEAANGIPVDLLARVAYQESHFRDDIVSGAVTSPAGAVGLFQLLPQYFPGAGKDWESDTNTAAAYLSQLYRQFGDWQLAVAAYNDGPGNIQKVMAGTKAMPTETQKYVADVFNDVPVAGSLVAVNA